MFSSPWKHISFCRMCPYLPKWSKPPGFCSLSIQFREALQIRAGLRAGELLSQSLFSGENSLAIKLEHPSWKCSRDFFSLSILPSLPRGGIFLVFKFHGFLALLELVRQISLTGDWPRTDISWPWGILGSLTFLVQSVWLCCSFRDFKSFWKHLETLKKCEVLTVARWNFWISVSCIVALLAPHAKWVAASSSWGQGVSGGSVRAE